MAIEDARRQTDVRLRQAARRASREAEEHLQAEERLEWSSEVTERLVRNPT